MYCCADMLSQLCRTLNQSADIGTGAMLCASCMQPLSRGMALGLSHSTR